MKRGFWFPLLLIFALLLGGCLAPTSGQSQTGAVVQGSTAAPTEPPASSTDIPTAEATDTLLPPTPVTPSLDTPAPPAADTPALPETPTSAPTVAPTDTPAPAPTDSPTPPPSPAPTRTPYPTGVFVASHRGFADGSTYFVVGEILNTAGFPVFGAKVIGNFYDSGGNLVGAQQTLASFSMTEPEVANPFKLRVENLSSAVARYELSLTWEDISLIEFHPLAVLETEVGQDAVTGQIRNDHFGDLTSIVIAVTFYDAAGGVVDTADLFLGGETLAPGESMPFTIPLPDGYTGSDHFWIEAQGNQNLF